MAGAFTESTVIGTASDTIDRLDLPEAEKTRLKNNIPVAYAVSYLVGTGFVVWFLSVAAPRLLRVDLKEESRKLAAQMSSARRSLGRAGAPGLQGMEHPCVSAGRRRGGPDGGGSRARREPRARLRGTHPARGRAHGCHAGDRVCNRAMSSPSRPGGECCSVEACRLERKSRTRRCSTFRWRRSTWW